MADQRIVSAAPLDDEAQFEAGLRPRRLEDFTGQSKLKENLAIAIEAARRRGEAMDHVLLYGPPGLGKTTLAAIIAEELGVEFQQTSGPILQKKLGLTGILSSIRPRQGLGSGPLRGRFGLVQRLNPYEVAELHQIVKRSARLLAVEIDEDGAEEVGRRSRGTPRIANRLRRRVRDYAEVRADGRITRAVAETALDLLEVDRFGLDEIDQKIMTTLRKNYGGGPGGVNTIGASIGEEPDTIEEVYEPYLIQLGFLYRTPRGRVGTDRAFDYFKIPRRFRNTVQNTLF